MADEHKGYRWFLLEDGTDEDIQKILKEINEIIAQEEACEIKTGIDPEKENAVVISLSAESKGAFQACNLKIMSKIITLCEKHGLEHLIGPFEVED